MNEQEGQVLTGHVIMKFLRPNFHISKRSWIRPVAFILVISITATSDACLNPVSAQDFWDAQPLTQEEEAAMLEALSKAQASGAASAAASGFAGLDPTGMTGMALSAQTQANMADFQKYIPGMMASNLQRAREYCASNPDLRDCQELARTLEQLGIQGR